MQSARAKRVIVFLALAYGFAWTVGFGFFALGGQLNSAAFVAIGLLYMSAPALAALLTQRFIWKEPWPDLGLRMPSLRWFAVAWLGPILLVILVLGLSLLLPGISLATGLDGFLAALADIMPPPKVAEVQRQLAPTILAKPGVLLLVSFVQALIAGPTINAVAAFGEEFGWRGFLLHQLSALGFWRSSWLIGFFWGVWHLPVIVNGHNYPGHPLIGSLMMTLLTMLLSPLIGYVRLRAQSVFAAAIFHGTFNAAATLAIFLNGGTALLVGMTGLVGLLTLFFADVVLWLHLRRNPVVLDNRVRE